MWWDGMRWEGDSRRWKMGMGLCSFWGVFGGIGWMGFKWGFLVLGSAVGSEGVFGC